MDLISHIRQTISEEKLVFTYRGIVTNDNSIPLLMLLEKEMETSSFGFIGRKRLFMFVLESLQNVQRHSENNVDDGSMSIIVYAKTDNGYSVSTGNVMSTKNVQDLKERLDEINNLSPNEIRNVYREMLGNSELSSKGGAGLGLIEMAKKVGNKLNYDFKKIDDEKSYYILNKVVDAEGKSMANTNDTRPFSGDSVIKLEKLMSDNNIYMIWAGHITTDIGKEMLSFTETKLEEDDASVELKRRLFSILVETLENVAKYCPSKEEEEIYGMPMAMIKLCDKQYTVITGNLIRNNEIAEFKKKLDDVNNCDREKLENMYLNSLANQTAKNERTGNMGLIDIARKSSNKLEYEFERINDDYSYFTLINKVV